MAVTVRVWSDFVCPFCMIAEEPLRQALEASDVDATIEWMPFELRPYPTPTLRPEDDYLRTVWPRAVLPLAARYAVAMSLPAVSPQPYTRLAWEGFRFAAERGQATAYSRRVFQAFFQEHRDIGDAGVLTVVAGEVGLDEQDFATALADRRYRQAHDEALAEGRRRGITSVPTFEIGGRRFRGVQPAEVLEAALRSAAAGKDEHA